MTIYGYYPGCSAHTTAQEYDASLRAVFAQLGLTLQEIQDWNCCGASSAHNLNADLAVALPARNLNLFKESGLPTITPCAACFNRLRVAQEQITAHPDRYSWMAKILGDMSFEEVSVRSPMGILLSEVGLDHIAAQVRRPLTGLRTVSYYGCLLARPHSISELTNTEYPRELDDLMEVLGADPQPWSYGVDCCGGSLSLTRPDITQRMTQILVDAAREAGADLMITACPLCQSNLEMRQSRVRSERLPALYFTEVLGIAFGLPNAEGWLRGHLVDPRPLLRQMEFVS